MRPFIQSENDNMFEFFVQLKIGEPCSIIFPNDYKLNKQMKQKLDLCCFPFSSETNKLFKFEATQCINYINDPLDEENYYYVYMLYDYQDTKEKSKVMCLTVSCIVSKYLYPKCFFTILHNYIQTQDFDTLSFYRTAKLQKTQFDTIIDIKNKTIPVFEGFSEESQIAYFHQFFISNFPKGCHYIPLIISFLFYDCPIVVFSSSFQTLTMTINSIASFFYPLNIMKGRIFPLLPIDEIDDKWKGPQVIGIPMAMFNTKLDKLENAILFNADEPFLSNNSINIPDDIFQEIDCLSQDLSNLCLYTQPAFPAPFFLKRIQAFISFLTKYICKKPKNCSFEEFLPEFKKFKGKSDDKSHSLLKLLVNESKKDPFVKSAFWENVSGEIIRFQGENFLSIRKVPIPSNNAQEENDSKRKKKGKK